MKKVILSMLLLTFTISFSACTNNGVPLENPQPELFSLFYTGDDYEIYKRIDIDEEKTYALIGYPIESDKGTTCTIGLIHLENYIVLYNNEYYDLQTGARLNLYKGNELINMGIDISCIED
jgi:hypothetical protein